MALELETPGRGVTIAGDALLREARIAAFAIITSLLRKQRLLTDHYGMRPTKMTVYLTIVLASAQRYVRRPTLGEEYRGVKPLPRTEVGAISRRALAAATGLPRETVRRIVAELIADGDVTEVGRSGVTSRVGELVAPGSQQALAALAAKSAHLFEELARLGVIVER